MLAAVLPFAFESGMVAARGDDDHARVMILNTGMQCDITVQTPDGRVSVWRRRPDRWRARHGRADRDRLSRHCGLGRPALLPTGRADTIVIDGIDALRPASTTACRWCWCGPPILAAAVTRPSRSSMPTANSRRGSRALRLACGHAMGLGDVSGQELPEDEPGRCAACRRQPLRPAVSSHTYAMTPSVCWPPSQSPPPACSRVDRRRNRGRARRDWQNHLGRASRR